MKTSKWRWVVGNRCVFSVRLKALSDRSGNRSTGDMPCSLSRDKELNSLMYG